MCGIAGFIDFAGDLTAAETERECFEKMKGALKRRGPDEEGINIIKMPPSSIRG
jgi:asparagine synthetase B (glutamine-hydrolysing)